MSLPPPAPPRPLDTKKRENTKEGFTAVVNGALMPGDGEGSKVWLRKSISLHEKSKLPIEVS